MAILDRGRITGSVRSGLGDITLRNRLGQNTITARPINETLSGVKDKSDEELEELANSTGYEVEDLKKIQDAQEAMDEALDICYKKKYGKKRPKGEAKPNVEQEDNFAEKYSPSEPGETPLNVCVGVELSERIGEGE